MPDSIELPADVLRRHGIDPRRAACLLCVAFTETQPRLFAAIAELGITNPGSSVVRTDPWPHVAEYNRVVRRVCTAPTTDDAIAALAATKPQVVRRLNVNCIVFNWFGHVDFDAWAHIVPDMTPAERCRAREDVADVLEVDAEGEPAGWGRIRWFLDWGVAYSSTAGQFLSVARTLRDMGL